MNTMLEEAKIVAETRLAEEGTASAATIQQLSVDRDYARQREDAATTQVTAMLERQGRLVAEMAVRCVIIHRPVAAPCVAWGAVSCLFSSLCV